MGAVPFCKDVPRLKHLGVGGVITLNEPFETLVPSSLYNAYEMEHLVIPTRDYLFAPLIADITRAVNFIHSSVSDPETPGCCNPKTLLLLKPSDDLKNDKDCSNEETDTALSLPRATIDDIIKVQVEGFSKMAEEDSAARGSSSSE